MKTASFSIAILNFFSRHGQYFHPTKDQPRTRPSSTFLYICYNFRQIFCTNVIQFFSVENMGHNQLQKCTKYHLVSLLNEKQGSTFANFLHFFYPVTLLTNSALSHLSLFTLFVIHHITPISLLKHILLNFFFFYIYGDKFLIIGCSQR